MTDKEAIRYDIIQELVLGTINGSEAARQLNLSLRQTQRLKAQVVEKGIEGIVHRSRGKPSNRKLSDDIHDEIIRLIHEKYISCKPTFISEKLEEINEIIVSKETVRSLMIAEKLWKVSSRKSSEKKRHTWRQRKDHFGEMQQFDGSYHKWWGDKESCLLASIDDATGKITHAKFDLNESTVAVFRFWLEYVAKHGLPLAIYLDKYSTYKINHKNAVDNTDLMTQFQRAMKQVGIQPITAHSPQAKGRIERLFETLQDRLVQELKLVGITTMEEANEFLITYIPKFNAQFSVVPAQTKDLHKSVPKQVEKKLPQIFSIQDTRVVQNDYTVMFETKFFQLNEIQPTTIYKKDTVLVETHLDGSIKLRMRDTYLSFQQLPQRPKKVKDVPLPAITTHKSEWKPPANHPWRTHSFQAKILKQN